MLLSEKTDFKSSEILSHNEGLFSILLEYLKDVETYGKHWKMCFNANKHSYSAASFHSLCNNKGPTVTLVEVDGYYYLVDTLIKNGLHVSVMTTREVLWPHEP